MSGAHAGHGAAALSLSCKGVPRSRLEQPRAWSSATRPGVSLTEKPALLTATRASRVHSSRSTHASKPSATSAPGDSFRGCVSYVSHTPGPGLGRGQAWNAARTRACATGIRASSSSCPRLLQDLTATLRRLSAGRHGNGTGLWNPEVYLAFGAHAST